MNMKNAAYAIMMLAFSAFAEQPDIAKYDSRMSVEGIVVTNGIKWIDGRLIPIEGRCYNDVDHLYDRLPSGVSTNVNAGVRNMKHHTTGMKFRFTTDSKRLVFKWVPYNPWLSMDHMPSTGMSGIDVYRFDAGEKIWKYVGTGRIHKSEGGEYSIPWTPGTPCLVNLPLYNGVKTFSLGVDPSAQIRPFVPYTSGIEKPVVFYGTSITHGGCASRPGLSFVNIVGRDLDVPVVNLGFSGSGFMEMEMSEHLARIDASCYVLDCLWNMGFTTENPGKGRNVDENYEPFIRNLRAKRPDVPIVMAEQCDVYCGGPNAKDRYIKSLYEKLVAEGWKNLVYLEKKGMYCDDLEGTVDGCHPNDWGMKHLAVAFGRAVSSALGLGAFAKKAPEDGVVTVDFGHAVGPMKPEHGVGQPPLEGISTSKFRYLAEAGVPYSRLHDVGGWNGQGMFVDIPNIFPDFDADENDPANYNFELTDVIIKGLVDSGVEPFYRLGVTIENYFKVKRLRTHPPKDFAKWARICEHVIRHYTEGWANGFKYKMTYWEIWNEPDGENGQSPMWSGTFEEFCRLYEVSSKHLKKCFPLLKIGGYGSSGVFKVVQEKPRPHDDYTMKCVDDFFAYVKKHDCPLDFFSIHAYDMPGALLLPEAMKAYGDYCRKGLDAIGMEDVELSMNEWLPRWSKPGSPRQAALCASLLIALQDSEFDNAMIYDARAGDNGLYSPLFSPGNVKPRLAYWSLFNFNELYSLGTQVALSQTPQGVYAIAATDGNGLGKVFAANIGGRPARVSFKAPGWKLISCRLTDADHVNTGVIFPYALPADSFAVYTFVQTP